MCFALPPFSCGRFCPTAVLGRQAATISASAKRRIICLWRKGKQNTSKARKQGKTLRGKALTNDQAKTKRNHNILWLPESSGYPSSVILTSYATLPCLCSSHSYKESALPFQTHWECCNPTRFAAPAVRRLAVPQALSAHPEHTPGPGRSSSPPLLPCPRGARELRGCSAPGN